MKAYRAHLFICTNQKPGGKECCSPKGADALRLRVKEEAKKRWGQDVRINSSGCLDACSEGIVAVLYPQGKWVRGLTDSPESEKALLDLIEENLP